MLSAALVAGPCEANADSGALLTARQLAGELVAVWSPSLRHTSLLRLHATVRSSYAVTPAEPINKITIGTVNTYPRLVNPNAPITPPTKKEKTSEVRTSMRARSQWTLGRLGLVSK